MVLIDSVIGSITYFFHRDGEKESVLRSILKAHPQWAKGHFLLSQMLFEKREWANAFVSISAAKILKFNKRVTDILEAKIFIQVARPSEAIALLLPMVELAQFDGEAAEELVAAYMQLEEYQNAYEVLKKIHARGPLNGTLKAAHDFVLLKLSH